MEKVYVNSSEELQEISRINGKLKEETGRDKTGIRRADRK